MAETPPPAPPAPNHTLTPSPGGGTPPPAPSGGNPPPTAGATPPGGDWTAGFNDDLKGWVQTKGVKSAADVVESYRNLEKLIGKREKLLELPDNFDDQKVMRPIWERLGAPKEAKDYNLEIPKDSGDATFKEWAQNKFHELGMPKAMAENLTKAWNERGAASVKTQLEARQNVIKQADEKLKSEWGAAYDQNLNIAREGVRTLGLGGKELDALESIMGREAVFKKMHEIGRSVGEHSFITGRPGSEEISTPEQARQQINDMMRDKDFTARLLANDMDAKRKWNLAHERLVAGQ